MPSCQNCHNKWSWKQTVIKTFSAIGGMTCPYCNEKQYISARTRKRSAVIPLTIVSIIMLGNLYFDASYLSLSALIVLIPLVFIIYPFYVEFSNEEELLF